MTGESYYAAAAGAGLGEDLGAVPLGFEPFLGVGSDDGLLARAGDLLITRDPLTGLVSGTTLGSRSDSYEYNDYGEVSRYTARFDSTMIFEVQYHRDTVGRLDQVTETIDGATRVLGYEYDLADRLSVDRRNGDVITSYTNDSNGNRLTANGERGSFTGSYNDRDQTTSYGGATAAPALSDSLPNVPGFVVGAHGQEGRPCVGHAGSGYRLSGLNLGCPLAAASAELPMPFRRSGRRRGRER